MGRPQSLAEQAWGPQPGLLSTGPWSLPGRPGFGVCTMWRWRLAQHPREPCRSSYALSTIITMENAPAGAEPSCVTFLPGSPRPWFLQTSCLQTPGLLAPSTLNELSGERGSLLPSEAAASLGVLQLGSKGRAGASRGTAGDAHACALCADRPAPVTLTDTGTRTPTGISILPCSYPEVHLREHPRGCPARPRRPHSCTRRPRVRIHRCHVCTCRRQPGAQTPGGRAGGSLGVLPPNSCPPSSWAPFCNSCIYFTVLYIGRGFQNTLGLFTKLCKNILSPLQLSLPERSGTCPSARWANCALCQQQPPAS